VKVADSLVHVARSPAERRRHPGRARKPLLLASIGVTVTLVVGASIGWRLAGGGVLTIATPSMCPALCVGTLVLDRPLSGPVVAGDVVTFRPPGIATVYTHRVAEVMPGGALKTRGDAVGRLDPWTVPRNRVIGVVVASVRGLGWLWRATPLVAAAVAVTFVARRWVDERDRADVDVAGATLAAVLPTLVFRPFVRTAVIAVRAVRRGRFVMGVVNTGLFSVRYRTAGTRASGVVAPGHLATVVAPAHGGPITLHAAPSLPLWGWVATVVVVLMPLIGLAIRRTVTAAASRRPRAPALVERDGSQGIIGTVAHREVGPAPVAGGGRPGRRRRRPGPALSDQPLSDRPVAAGAEGAAGRR
jgi:hypothetical protein